MQSATRNIKSVKIGVVSYIQRKTTAVGVGIPRKTKRGAKIAKKVAGVAQLNVKKRRRIEIWKSSEMIIDRRVYQLWVDNRT